MSQKNRKREELILTTGQESGVEANAIVGDQQNGFLNDPNSEQLSWPGGKRLTLTSSISVEGSEQDITLFSGPASGRSSNQNTMESGDERERRWGTTIKKPTPESPGIFGEGNASVRLPRSTDPDVTKERPVFKPGQGSKALTKGADD